MAYLTTGALTMKELATSYATPKSTAAQAWDWLKGTVADVASKMSPTERAYTISQGSKDGGATYVAPASKGITTTHLVIGGAALVGLFLVLKKK